jgi:NAD(P)-dependent dehydrogenase (short-subunit alcohol dehydrogenase family)
MTDTTTGRFAGSTIIVTGAGSGIGRATATRIAQEGGRVIATDVVVARLDALRTERRDRRR